MAARRRLWLLGLLMVALAGIAPLRDAAAQGDINNLLILPRAASNDDFDGVLGLLQRGDYVDTDGEDDRTALSFAAGNGNIRIANLLLDHLAAIDHRDRFGDGALHWAALNGKNEMVKRLLAAKADINMQNREGVTALMMAISNNRREVVRTLVASGADIQIQDFSGHDALSWARDKPAILSMLKQAH